VSEELGTIDVPSRRIGPNTFPEILVLDAHGLSGGNGQSGLLTASRLHAGFFVRRDDELRTVQGFALPDSGVEIADAPSFCQRNRNRVERSNCGTARDEGHRHLTDARVSYR
jgi:hypothetical protein